MSRLKAAYATFDSPMGELKAAFRTGLSGVPIACVAGANSVAAYPLLHDPLLERKERKKWIDLSQAPSTLTVHLSATCKYMHKTVAPSVCARLRLRCPYGLTHPWWRPAHGPLVEARAASWWSPDGCREPYGLHLLGV